MLGDKSKYIEHIEDKEQHIVMRKVLDKAEAVIKYHETSYTDFLDPYQRDLAYSILNTLDLKYFEEGGLEDAERKSIVIYPEYMMQDNIENPIKAVKIEGSFKFNDVSHRDYLGAIMGLGVKREVIGDIFVREDFATVIMHMEIMDFFIYNLDAIGKESVEVKQIELSQVEKPIEEFDEIVLTLSSLRLDTLISGIYKISRSKSAALINQDRVKVNWKPTSNISHEITIGDILSIRKLGRVKVVEDLGQSRKGKDRIKVEKYK